MKYLLCFIGLAGSLLGVQGQSFKALLSSPTVQQGQTFSVTFTAENLENGEFTPPDFGKLDVLGSPKMSQGVQVINGNVSRSLSYTYYLRTNKTGTYRVGAATYKLPGKSLKTENLDVKVVAGQAPASNAPQNDPAARQANISAASLADNLFLRASSNKNKVYQGEQLTFTYKVYTERGYNIVGLSAPEQPDFDGFWLEPVEIKESRYRPDEFNGKTYNSFVIDQMVLIPQKTGKITIEPYHLQTSVQVLVKNQRSQSFFDSFFDRYQNVELPLASNELTIEVVPLPQQGKPDLFSGAVGTYTMNVQLDTSKVQTGEAITLRVELDGKGYLKAINMPKPDFPQEFDAYTPKVDDRIQRSSGQISSHKTIDYVLVPRRPGTFALPLIQFAYFDIAAGRYKILEGPSYTVTVEGEALAGPVEEVPFGTAASGAPVLYGINQDPGPGIQRQQLAGSWTYWGLWTLPMLLFAGFYVVQARQQKSAADVTGTRRRNASKEAVKRLATAHQKMKKGEEKAFYDELVRAMYGYVGDKLSLRPSALSRERISEALRAEQVREERIARFTRILDDSEMALFAPMAIKGGMQTMYDQASALITEMENDIEAV